MAYSPWSLLDPETLKQMGYLPGGSEYDLMAQDREPAGAFDNSPPAGLVGPPMPPAPRKANTQSPWSGISAQKPMITFDDVPNPGAGGNMKKNTASKLAQQDARSTTNRILRLTPDESTEATKVAMGITPGYQLDENGNILHKQIPVMDARGMPVINEFTGQPELKEGDPILDPTQDVVNPEHPVQQELQGIEQMKNLLAMQAAYRKPQVDLSPLLALADSQTGSKLQGSYHPRNYDEMNKQVLAYADEIQKRRADIARAVGQQIQASKAGQQTDLLSLFIKDQIEKSEGNKPVGAGHADQNDWKWIKWVQSESKKDDEFSTKLVTLRGEVASGNPIDDARIRVIRATLDAGGRPNMAEVQTEAGAKDIVSRAQQAYETLKSGNLTDSNRDLILSSIDDMQKYLQIRRSAQMKRFGNVGKAKGVSGDVIKSNLPAEYQNAYTYGSSVNQPAKSSSKAEGLPSMEAIKAERARREALKAGGK